MFLPELRSQRTDFLRMVGAYIGRKLKSEKPASMPVQQATRVELIVNLDTPKARYHGSGSRC
jgi:hypothetical protein